jgi:hypothetical protein
MSARSEFLAFRARFTDEEWSLFIDGKCGQVTEYGTVAGIVHCGESRGDDLFYCAEHVSDTMINYGATLASLTVPASVMIMTRGVAS